MTDIREMLRHAYQLATIHSDDPDTKNGAVLVSADGRPIGIGMTGFAIGVRKLPERFQRPTKYGFLEHAERRAIFAAARKGECTEGATLYCPWAACAECARALIDSGIVRVVAHKQALDRTPDRWKDTVACGDEQFRDAGVEKFVYDGPIGDCIGLLDRQVWYP